MTPTQECNIWDFNDETQMVKVITLTVWNSALKLELKGIQMHNPKVSTIVREFLSVPSSYPLADLSLHIQTSLDSVKEQLGIPLEEDTVLGMVQTEAIVVKH
jgi:hypothetical protein